MLLSIDDVLKEAEYKGKTSFNGRKSFIFETTLCGEETWIIVTEVKGRGISLYSISDSNRVLTGIEKPIWNWFLELQSKATFQTGLHCKNTNYSWNVKAFMNLFYKNIVQNKILGSTRLRYLGSPVKDCVLSVELHFYIDYIN